MGLAGKTLWVRLPSGNVVACDANSVIARYAQDVSYSGWEVVDPPDHSGADEPATEEVE